MPKIEITQEKLEQALKACCTEEPIDHDPCMECYLYNLRDKTGHLSTGKSCFEHLAYDIIAYIWEINDFEKSQCAKLLETVTALKSERDELKKAVLESSKWHDRESPKLDKIQEAMIALKSERDELKKALEAAIRISVRDNGGTPQEWWDYYIAKGKQAKEAMEAMKE